MYIYSQDIFNELKRRYTTEQIKSLSSMYFVRGKGHSMPRVDFYNAYWRTEVLGEEVYKPLYSDMSLVDLGAIEDYENADYMYPREYNEEANISEYQIMTEHEGVFKDIIRMLLKPFEDMPLYLNCGTHIGKIALWRLKNGV